MPATQLVPDRDALSRHARRRAGLPRRADHGRTWPQRTVRNPWVWLGLLLVASYVFALHRMYVTLTTDQKVDATHIQPGLNWEAIHEAAGLASRTALVWTLVFLLLDRFRRQSWWMYVLAWGWGACMATWASMHLNDLFGQLMMVRGAGSPSAGARPAIFSAPFVEEGCKATIVFLLVVLCRNRISSIVQAVTLAGMSAIGFAFTENIVYYARARVFASYTASAGDADAAVHQLFLTRGIYTSFGHMMFTSMTGIGLGIAVRTRSKVVRVLAPVTGFVVAACMHMMFNGTSTVMQTHAQEVQFYLLGWSLVAGMVTFMVGQQARERRRIRQRLTDFVRMGWLLDSDPVVYSSLRQRGRLLVLGLRHGWTTFTATRRLMVCMNELAYTRDAMVRGTIDDIGNQHQAELLAEIAALSGIGLRNPAGMRLDIPWHRALFWRHRRRDAVGWDAPAPALAPASAMVPASAMAAPAWPAQQASAPWPAQQPAHQQWPGQS